MGEELSNNIELNRVAQERFQQLKQKMQLDIQRPIIKEILEKTKSRVEELFDKPIPSVAAKDRILDNEIHSLYGEAEKNVQIIDATFNAIDTLKLSSNLALAVGLLVSYSKTKNKDELEKAIKAIESEWI